MTPDKSWTRLAIGSLATLVLLKIGSLLAKPLPAMSSPAHVMETIKTDFQSAPIAIGPAKRDPKGASAPAAPEVASIPHESLSPDVVDDLKFLLRKEAIERDFLLNRVGVSEDTYREIHQHQLSLYAQLMAAPSWAPAYGMTASALRRDLLSRHVEWMQYQIGVGNYAQLQALVFEGVD